MGFNVSQITSGFDLTRVRSDDKHYGSFVCGICTNLVSLDAVVTSRCSHPFCRRCLESWALQCNIRQAACTCPLCKNDLSSGSSVECMAFGTVEIAARPLQEAQPLAFRVLGLVQVSCFDKNNEPCCWTGDYGKLLSHVQCHTDEDGHDHLVIKPTKDANDESDQPEMRMNDAFGVENARNNPPGSPQRCMSRSKDIKGGKEFVVAEEKSTSRSEASTSVDQNNQNPASPRWNASTSLGASPEAQKQRLSSARDAPPNMVTRKKSGVPQQLTEAGVTRTSSGDGQHVDCSIDETEYENEEDENGDHTEFSLEDVAMEAPRNKRGSDWNTSINSMGCWSEASSDHEHMETLDEKSDEDETLVELIDEDTYTTPEVKTQQIVDRTQKLKKQANAKFNKGDFSAARVLYTEGIKVMSAFNPATLEEKELMSHMHSNRGVTYFREKDFKLCIYDCEKAIEFDPNYDKNWVRLWRAWMALGEFETAHSIIEKASKIVPDSERIREELERSRMDNDLLQQGENLIKAGNLIKAKDLLFEHSKNSTNLKLLCMAARIDALLGVLESALEQVNRVLRLNPKYPEGLELHGFSLFLKGETEKAAQLLYESYNLNSDSPTVKPILTQCQKTHAALSQARSCMKKGRYEEALTSFAAAIKESAQIPKETPLYLTIRVERADAWLRSSKFLEALKECQEIFTVDKEYIGAWIVRSNVLVALGKATDAKKELAKIRKTWGADNVAIEEVYRKVDFELRLSKAEQDLMRFVKEMDAGICQRFEEEAIMQPEHSRSTSRKQHSHRKNPKKAGAESGDESITEKSYSKREGIEIDFDDDFVQHREAPDGNSRRSRMSRSSESKAPKKKSANTPSSPLRRHREKQQRRPSAKGEESPPEKQSHESPKQRIKADASRERRRSDPSHKSADDAASVMKERSRPRKSLDDSRSVMTERRPRPRKSSTDDAVSVSAEKRAKSRSRVDDGASVVSERRRSRRLDDGASVATERRPRPRKVPDDAMSVGGEHRSKPRRRPDDSMSVVSSRIKPRRRDDDSLSDGEERKTRKSRDKSDDTVSVSRAREIKSVSRSRPDRDSNDESRPSRDKRRASILGDKASSERRHMSSKRLSVY